MKSKYNDMFPRVNQNSDWHGSYIQTYLGKEMEYLLTPSATQLSQVDFEKIYIQNSDMEAYITPYRKHTLENNICVVYGLVGTGKTMLVRHIFNIHSMSPKINENTLVIPFNFNNAVYTDVSKTFVQMLHAVCDTLVEAYPELHHIDKWEEEFYEFIKLRRRGLLYMREAYPTPSKTEQLRNLLEENPLAFYASALKFYLSQTDVCPINNVVIVLDDLEGIRVDSHILPPPDARKTELLPIEMVLELIECMQNQAGEIVQWSLNTIICCRHYVSRMMRSIPYSADGNTYIQKLESYPVFKSLDMVNRPSIKAIVQKRYDALLENNRNQSEKWTVAMQVSLELIKKIDDNVTNFIMDLTLGNARLALNQIKHIVFNKRWIQRDSELQSPGAFQIRDLDQFNSRETSMIRAIGMNENIIYDSQDSVIPNLLYNEPDSNMELFVLLALKHFLILTNFQEQRWAETSYSVQEFREDTAQLFKSQEYNRHFRVAIRYLLKHRLLLRAFDQEQMDNRSLSEDDLDFVTQVFVPQIATTLWNYMGLNSILFEMYVDDIWMENDSRNLSRSVFRGFDYDNFNAALGYMDTLISAETAILSQAYNEQGNADEYRKLFGDEPICGHLLNGLENSLRAYFRQPDAYTRKTFLVPWSRQIERLKVRCQKIYS